MNRRWARMTLRQLLDKIGDLDEKSILKVSFQRPKFCNPGSIPYFSTPEFSFFAG
jgi:hypothetical protein